MIWVVCVVGVTPVNKDGMTELEAQVLKSFNHITALPNQKAVSAHL